MQKNALDPGLHRGDEGCLFIRHISRCTDFLLI